MGVKVLDGKLSGTTHAALNTDFRRNDGVIQKSLKGLCGLTQLAAASWW